MAEEVHLDFGRDLVQPSAAIELALVSEREGLALVLVQSVAAGHVGELHDPANATPAHPHLGLLSEVHVSQIVDELNLVESYVFVLLFDLDWLGQIEVNFRLLRRLLSWLELGP